MAGLGTIVTVTDNLLVALQSDSFRMMSNRLQLDKLENTVADFRALLDEVEAKEEHLLHLSRIYEVEITNARCVIYKLDDLVDELLTRGHLKRKGVQWLFPDKMLWMDHFNTELRKYITLQRVRLKPLGSLRMRRKQIPSRVDSNIVGRENAVQAVLQRLLQSSSDVLSIVGLKGIGKTTLANLIFDHPTIQTEFPLRFWVQVSKNYYESFDAHDVLSEILSSCSDLTTDEVGIQLRETIGVNKYILVLDNTWTVDPEQWLLFKDILPKGGQGSRILVTTRLKRTTQIVGDFIPYELRGLSEANSWSFFQKIAFPNVNNNLPPSHQFVELAKQAVHKCCGHPHAIREVARLLYAQEIKPWQLSTSTWTLPSQMVSYYNLPFTLKSCYSYCALFPLDSVMRRRMLINLWMAQGYLVSSKVGQSTEDVGEECFSVLLEMGFFEVAEVDEWGEIVSRKMHDPVHRFAKEVVGEEFFEGNPISYEMDNTYHLFLCKDPTGGNFSFTKTNIRSWLRDAYSRFPVDALVNQCKSLRTLDLHGLKISTLPDSVGELLHLRYLDLSRNIYLEALPKSIVKLHNLQTLDLRFCGLLNELPEELRRLSALRCLDIFGCDGLTRMPLGMEKLTCLHHLSLFVVADGISSAEIRDLKKLVNLRGCICISIPRSYTNVKRIDWKGGCLEMHEHLQEVWVRFLESLSVDNSDQRVVNYHQIVLEKLQPHTNIKKLMLWGYQGAIIPKWGRAEDNWADTLGCLVKIELRSCEKLKQLPLLSNLPHLKSLELHGLRQLEYLENNAMTSSTQQARAFFPSLQELEITNAPKLRGFWDGNTSVNCVTFPVSLVRIELRSCDKLQQLSLLSNLPLLKSLKLYGLSNLESITSSLPQPDTLFFPSLEELEIVDVPKLRGFGSVMAPHKTSCFRSLKSLLLAHLPELREFYCLEGGDDGQKSKLDDHTYTLQFGFLSELRLSNCPKLVSIPLVPNIEILEVINIHADLLKHIVDTRPFNASSSKSSTLRKVDIMAVHELHNLPTRLSNVESLTVKQCELLEILDLGTPSYVKRLTIQECGRLKEIMPGLKHFSFLEELEIKDCEELEWEISPGIAQNLKTLTLTNMSKYESLPKRLGYLKKLEKLSLSWLYDLRSLPDEIELLHHLSHLTIRWCQNLTVLPESLGRLPSLKKLEIKCCTRLYHIPDSLDSEYVEVLIRNCPQLHNRFYLQVLHSLFHKN